LKVHRQYEMLRQNYIGSDDDPIGLHLEAHGVHEGNVVQT